MIFSAMLILLIVLIEASTELAVYGTTESFGTLWGKNILGKYDLYLKNRYGILAFYGNDYTVEEDLKKYAEYSFGNKKYITSMDIKSNGSKYKITDVKSMEKAVIEAVTSGKQPQGISEEDSLNVGGKPENRSIKADWIIRGLPSYGRTEELYLSGVVNQLKAGLGVENLIKQQVIDKYIFTFFKDYMENRDLPETFFGNEIEYIISGKYSDESARKNVETKLKILRNMLNLYYLYSCSEKRQGALTLAEMITPGPAAVLTQAVILETWAYQEAENDINILYEGGAVPFIKKDQNWALTLDNVFNEDGSEKEYEDNKRSIKPDKMEGEGYEAYLGILLCGLPKKTKLLRIMDLIQVNGKFLYGGDFLLSDYCNGVCYSIEINGRIHKFEDSY